MAIRALLFDLSGTLVEDSPAREEPRRQARLRLTREALAASGLPFPDEAISRAFQAFNEEHAALHARGRDFSVEERVARFLEHLQPGLTDGLSSRGLRAIEDALDDAIREHPPVPKAGAHEVLNEAGRRGLATGLVSNTGITPGFVLRELLAENGLLPRLRVLTFSDEACLAKPAPEMFRCTLEALGVAPGEAAFVGDLPPTDVAGALAVGMWAVLLGDKQVDGVEPHARIGALNELFPALEELGLL